MLRRTAASPLPWPACRSWHFRPYTSRRREGSHCPVHPRSVGRPYRGSAGPLPLQPCPRCRRAFKLRSAAPWRRSSAECGGCGLPVYTLPERSIPRHVRVGLAVPPARPGGVVRLLRLRPPVVVGAAQVRELPARSPQLEAGGRQLTARRNKTGGRVRYLPLMRRFSRVPRSVVADVRDLLQTSLVHQSGQS